MTLIYGKKNFIEYEEAAINEFDRVAFVYVTGGLAECLNCRNAIKVQI